MEGARIEELATAARRLGPVVAIELQWVGHEDVGDSWSQGLEVCAVVARPGATDSRYRTFALTSLPGDSRNEQQAAAAAVQALAARLEVEASLLAMKQMGFCGSRWIDAQGSAPEATYRCAWHAYWWDDDGRRQSGEGVEEADAVSGDRARALVGERVRARLGAERRVVGMRVAIEGWPWEHLCEYIPARPPTVPPIGDVQAWRRSGLGIAAILRRLRDRTPAPTALDLMLTLTEAFSLRLPELAPVADWAAGLSSDAALDAAVEPLVTGREPRWDRRRRLRQGAIDGRFPDQIRIEQGTEGTSIGLLIDLQGAFGIGLGESQILGYYAWAKEDANAEAFLVWIREGKSLRSWMTRHPA